MQTSANVSHVINSLTVAAEKLPRILFLFRHLLAKSLKSVLYEDLKYTMFSHLNNRMESYVQLLQQAGQAPSGDNVMQ